MINNFQIQEIRKSTKTLNSEVNFDASYKFFYDESNNVRKFHVRETDFNSLFTSNFILGGLVYDEHRPNILPFIEELCLQQSVKEVRFKHIAKGEFIDCLKYEKLKLFLQYLNDNDIYIHYTSLNLLFWSIVDIVDSAILNLTHLKSLESEFVNYLKNDLYKLCKLEIDSVVKLFYTYEYPNIKSEKVTSFIQDLVSLFDNYKDTDEFNFGLESLKKLLNKSMKTGELPFIMNNEDYVLIKNLSQIYLKPIYMFKKSTHILDDEVYISDILKTYKILDGDEEISNYLFVDSQSNYFIQLSDVLVGLIGKFKIYLNTNTKAQIISDLNSLSDIQYQNLDLLISVINKSDNKNLGFICNIDSYEEISKMRLVWDIRSKKRL